ncbi:hypothetical protein [Nocardia abscessus]|uniref:hypothetical protein n=1 Tax=Nocardia abscessus TaxID=120957 RepID=UPI002456C705|nr:hypothetical protein [Nocardia abscessus]
MSGDPVEESSQAMRQGFVQALQTAHTTAALMRGQSGHARSKAESDQRIRHADAKEHRSSVEHWMRVTHAVEAAGHARDLNGAKVDEVRARIQRGDEQHTLEQRQKQRQIERADTDLARREKVGSLELKQSRELHRAKLTAYEKRETRADELHGLDVEYKNLLIDIRRRAAGFSDTLSAHGDTGQAMASAAAFAAAKGAEGLSEQHADEADAYAERFTEDTGSDPSSVIDAALVDDIEDIDPPFGGAAPASLPSAIESGPSIIDATIVEDIDSPLSTARQPSPVAIEDVIGLTEELSVATHLAHEFADLVGAPDPDAGSVIGDAVDAAGLTDDGTTPVMDFGIDTELPDAAMPRTPDLGHEL